MNNFFILCKKNILRFIERYRAQLIILALFISVLGVLRSLPYINVFLIKSNTDLYLIIISILLLFKSNLKGTLYLTFFIILINLIAALLQLDKLSEILGNFIYFLFIIILSQYLLMVKNK